MFLLNKEKRDIYKLVMKSLDEEPENWEADLPYGIVNTKLLGGTEIWLANGCEFVNIEFMSTWSLSDKKSISNFNILGFLVPWRVKLYLKAKRVVYRKKNILVDSEFLEKEKLALQERISSKTLKDL